MTVTEGAKDVSRSRCLFLGPISLTLRADRPLYDEAVDEALLDPFAVPGPELEIRHNCLVEMQELASRPPVSEGRTYIFDAGVSWRLLKTAAGKSIFQRSTGLKGDFDAPAWELELGTDATHGVLFAGASMHKEGPLGPGWHNPLCYPLDQMLLLGLLPRVDCLLVHGACLDFGNGAVVYTGKSGAGKTTLSRLVRDNQAQAEIITDDRVLLIKTGDGWLAGGTPWPGEGRFAMNVWRPLRALHFLEQGRGNRFQKITDVPEAMERLFPVVSVPWYDPGPMTTALSLCQDLLLQIPMQRFIFERKSGAAAAAREFAEGLDRL